MKVRIVPESKAVHDRADQKWSTEIMTYIFQYIGAISYASNPLNKGSVGPYIKANAKKAIKSCDLELWNYARRLFNERDSVETNYK